MRQGSLASVLLAALVGLSAPAAAAVSVSFIAPESYSDANPYGRYRGPASASVLRDLEAHLVKLGQRYLPADRSLKIAVLDIDLAGEYEPFRFRLYDVRVLRGVTWPRIKLRYMLEQDGRVLREAEELIGLSARRVTARRYRSPALREAHAGGLVPSALRREAGSKVTPPAPLRHYRPMFARMLRAPETSRPRSPPAMIM